MTHRTSFEVVERGSNGHATKWIATCTCRNVFTGPTYENVEDQWREHVWLLTGNAPDAWGSKESRWQPPVAAGSGVST